MGSRLDGWLLYESNIIDSVFGWSRSCQFGLAPATVPALPYVICKIIQEHYKELDFIGMFIKKSHFCSLLQGAGAGSGLKIPGAGAVPKQDGSEKRMRAQP